MTAGPVPYLELGVYEHTKSRNKYQVIGVGIETETGDQVVIYKPMYAHPAGYELFSRPYSSFTEIIELDGKKVLRFVHIDEQ